MTVKEHKKIVLVETNIFFSAKIVAQLKQLGYSMDTESSYQGVKDKAGLGIFAIMWPAFRNSFQNNCPGIQIIYDKYSK